MRDQQAVEGVARPGEVERLPEPRRRGRVIEQPPVVVGQPVERAAPQPNSPDLNQELQLEERRR